MRSPRRRQPNPLPKDALEDFRLAKPVPSRRKYVPTPEEWAAWCDHPVTQWVAAAYEAQAARCREAWTAASWANGLADPLLLKELRTRADNFEAFTQSDYKDILRAATKTR